MEITNRTEKRIYDLLIVDMIKSEKGYSILTNVEISKMLDISPITARDKVIKLTKQGHLISLVKHFDDTHKYFARKILKGNTPG